MLQQQCCLFEHKHASEQQQLINTFTTQHTGIQLGQPVASFSCADMTVQGFLKISWPFNTKLGLANTICHWTTGVKAAENGPLFNHVDIPS